MESWRRYPDSVSELRERTGIDVEYVTRGTIHTLATAEDVRAAEARLRHAWAREVGIEAWDAADLRRHEPALSTDVRGAMFEELRGLTPPGGFHAHIVFTERRIYREKNEVVHYFAPNELRDAYRGWIVLRDEEGLIPCAQDGVRHVHSVETLIAQRP